MNPRKLFTLTEKQKQLYQVQPDGLPGYTWDETAEEYELPPYIDKTTLRFWYNTQDTVFTTHWHDAQEIIIPLETEFHVTVQNVPYCLQPGDILLIPPGELHSIDPHLPGSRFIFLLELNFFGQLGDFLRTRALLSGPILINARTCPEIYETEISLIMQTAAHYWGSGPSRLLFIYACLLNFYAHYTDYCTGKAISDESAPARTKAGISSEKIVRLLEYLQHHYAENITLEEAARKTALSKFYFTRIFKQQTGQTFYDYLSFLRIQAAEALLKDTSVPVSEVAASCGYANVSSFNRTFRRYRECSPQEYRNLYGHGA